MVRQGSSSMRLCWSLLRRRLSSKPLLAAVTHVRSDFNSWSNPSRPSLHNWSRSLSRKTPKSSIYNNRSLNTNNMRKSFIDSSKPRVNSNQSKNCTLVFNSDSRRGEGTRKMTLKMVDRYNGMCGSHLPSPQAVSCHLLPSQRLVCWIVCAH